jgi:thioredoxin 1
MDGEINMKILTKDEFNKQAMTSKTPYLIDFYADWCGPCRMLGPVLEELSEDPDLKGKLNFAKVNTEETPELAEEHNVSGIPCLIIFKNGKEATRIVGFAPKTIMKAKIKAAVEDL